MFTAELTEGGLAQECFDVKVGHGLGNSCVRQRDAD